jgi:uncharacterized protein YebE (UPF0316 family)
MTWLLVFVACAALDILYVKWTILVHQKAAVRVAIISAIIQIIGMCAVLAIVADRTLLVANVLGHAFGSYIGIRFDWSKKQEDNQA